MAYHLESVPQPPQTDEWRQILRWMIAVMDDDDPDFDFIAGLFSYCTRNGGLTDRQAKYGLKCFKRIELMFDAGSLDLQRGVVAV